MTYLEFANKYLNKPTRHRFIENISTPERRYKLTKQMRYRLKSDFINYAFTWSHTDEGDEYWTIVFYKFFNLDNQLPEEDVYGTESVYSPQRSSADRSLP